MQRVLPATESGPGTIATNLSMNGHKMSIYGPDECDPENFGLSWKNACETETGCCFHGYAADWFCFHLQVSIGIGCIVICLWVQVYSHVILSS